MERSVFKVTKMDCPAEENLVKIGLEGFDEIVKLSFDIPNRKLTIIHDGPVNAIEDSLNGLNLGSSRISTETVTSNINRESTNQKKLLWAVLGINLAFFIIEMTTGLISRSMGLVADSLDMLADSFVYGISLMAVGGTLLRKKRVARIAGYFQITLALLGFIEVLRRFFGQESIPDFRTMIIVSVLALIANSICLYLLQLSKNKHEAHMKASMIFTSNDVIINLGVIAAGLLVHWFKSGKPDLIIGTIVFILVTRGAHRILRLGKQNN